MSRANNSALFFMDQEEQDLDQLLSGVYKAERIQAAADAADAQFEERLIKLIMTKAGLESEIRTLGRMAEEKTGKYKIRWSWFSETYPSFPIDLRPSRLPKVWQTSFADLFNKFTTTKMCEAWMTHRDSRVDDDKPFGVVYQMPQIKGKYLIIHDMSRKTVDFETRISRRVGTNARPVILTIERFDPMLEDLLSTWVP